MKNRPFVLNTHGSLLGYKNYLPSFWQRVPYHLYDLITLKTSAKRAQAVVVSSKLEYQDALEFGIPRNKLHIIPMGIEVEEPASVAPQKNHLLKLLFVGRVARVRRVELILQAVRRLTTPFHLTIVGGEEKTSSMTSAGYMLELRRLCSTLGIDNHVTFTGSKAPDELNSFYNEADVFVYPSLYENFGQPILEAAAAGLPVVATSVGVAREIITDGETGFLISPEPAAIADRIERLSDYALRQSIGNEIRKTVRSRYGWEEIIDRYMELYQSL